MGFLQHKRILITGLLSDRSIAYGIAQSCKREGAELAFTYVGERFKPRVEEFAAEFGSDIVLPCDVTSDEQIASTAQSLSERWDRLDGLVHAVAFAQREAISGEFLDGLTRESFLEAQNVSAYSFPALVKALLPLLRGADNNNQSAVLTLSYLGAERAVPHYNTMGVAKAALESCVRYLAAHLGLYGIRANGISAGPLRTLAASGIKDFNLILKIVATNAPLHRNITIEEVGNVAAFMLSDLASGITGEITHVDAGFNTVMGGAYPLNGE